MRLFRRRPSREEDGGTATPSETDAGAADHTAPSVDVSITVAAGPYPVCSQCGRTDLPLVGGWDPPICLECDAQINEDAMQAEIDDR